MNKVYSDVNHNGSIKKRREKSTYDADYYCIEIKLPIDLGRVHPILFVFNVRNLRYFLHKIANDLPIPNNIIDRKSFILQ